MDNYENKTNEELIELLEAKDEQICDFEENEQHCSDLEDENRDLQNVIDDFNSALSDREEVSEAAFFAGHNDGLNGNQALKSWLNYKIGARI